MNRLTNYLLLCIALFFGIAILSDRLSKLHFFEGMTYDAEPIGEGVYEEQFANEEGEIVYEEQFATEDGEDVVYVEQFATEDGEIFYEEPFATEDGEFVYEEQFATEEEEYGEPFVATERKVKTHPF